MTSLAVLVAMTMLATQTAATPPDTLLTSQAEANTPAAQRLLDLVFRQAFSSQLPWSGSKSSRTESPSRQHPRNIKFSNFFASLNEPQTPNRQAELLHSNTKPSREDSTRQEEDPRSVKLSTLLASLNKLESRQSQLPQPGSKLTDVPLRSLNLSRLLASLDEPQSRQSLLESMKTHLYTKLTSQDMPRSIAPPEKRSRSRLCQLLAFPVSKECVQRVDLTSKPETRSGSLDQQDEGKWPSMYLLGGAVGR